MATHSSIVAWRIPGTGAWWAAVYGIAQNRTRLMWLSSSSMKSSRCWERLKTVGEGDDRGWNGCMASLNRRVWASSGSWWWTEKPGMPQSTGLQRVRHDWVTELNQTSIKGAQNPYIELWFSQTYFKFKSECINCLWNWPEMFSLYGLSLHVTAGQIPNHRYGSILIGNSIGSPVNIYQSMEWILL